MDLITMSYRGVDFNASPYEFNIKMSKSVSKTAIPFFSEKTNEICENSRVILGKGRFTSPEAVSSANSLMAAFKAKGSDYLYSPAFAPIKMYFTELNINLNSDSSLIEYSFVFTEDTSDKQRYKDFAYTRVRLGENLFDIANRSGVSVETLCELNSIRDIFSLSEGDKIWLK